VARRTRTTRSRARSAREALLPRSRRRTVPARTTGATRTTGTAAVARTAAIPLATGTTRLHALSLDALGLRGLLGGLLDHVNVVLSLVLLDLGNGPVDIAARARGRSPGALGVDGQAEITEQLVRPPRHRQVI
jgi:hypothetical protein